MILTAPLLCLFHLLEKHEFLVLIMIATWILNLLFFSFLDTHVSPASARVTWQIPSCCSGLQVPVTLTLAMPRVVPDPLGALTWGFSGSPL